MNNHDELLDDFLESFNIHKVAMDYYREQHHSYNGYDFSVEDAQEFAREASARFQLSRSKNR